MPGATLAERLKEALADRGITQIRLEEEAGVAKGYVSHLMKGSRTKVRAEQAGKLARVLGVETAWLVEGIGPKRSATTIDGDPMVAQLEAWARANMPGNGVTNEVLAAFIADHRFAGGEGSTLDDLYADLLGAARAAKKAKPRFVGDEETEIRRTLSAGGASQSEIEQEIEERREASRARGRT